MTSRTLRGGLYGFAAIILILSGCASGPEPAPEPVVAIESVSPTFISPESSEGTRDIFEAPVTVGTPPEVGLTSMTVSVEDDAGVIVRVFERRASGEEETIEPFDTAVWDGRNEEGAFVVQGKYTLMVRIEDQRGRMVQSEPVIVVVDNEAPRASISAPYTVFSPDGDGNKDLFYVSQEGSVVESWVGSFLSAEGEVVREYSWTNTEPPRVSWDGRSDEGERVPDGEYRYRLVGRDAAGNEMTAAISPIRLDTTDYQVSLSRSRNSFSPNGDGRQDTLLLSVEMPDQAVTVSEWELVIRDGDNRTVRSETGEGALPGEWEYRGRGDNGQVLGEAEYRAQLTVQFRNGDTASAESAPFEIDLTAPEVSVEAGMEIFSPNGDGNKEEIPLQQRSEGAERWQGAVVSAESADEARDAAALRSFSWEDTLPETRRWSGTNDAGEEAPDGSYRYRLSAIDDAGNRSTAISDPFTKDTSAVPEVSLSPETRAFSPDDDGTKDSLRFNSSAERGEGLQQYRFSVENSAGRVVYSETGEDSLPETLVWNGVRDDGSEAPAGAYTATLQLRYENGNAPVVTTQPLRVDRSDPEINVSAQYRIFSPDGDGNRDSVRFTQSSSSENRWEARILNANGDPVYSRTWSGEARDLSWSGVDEEGEQVPDGDYRYVVTARDAAGNSVQREIRGITVDTRQPSVSISAPAEGFSPNDDGRQDSLTLELYTSISEGIQGWTVTIRNSSGNAVRSFSSGEEAALPETLSWFGRNDDGDRVAGGRYNAALSLDYRKGNEPIARTESPVVVDLSAPTVDPEVSPKPFSPDGDGVEDQVRISLNAADNRGIASWELTILDPGDNSFRQFSGEDAPTEPISWNGRSDEGERVQAAEQYPVRTEVTDVYGNRTVAEATVSVDILVTPEEDGDRRIRVTSIQFVPFEADYRNLEDQEERERNMQTLDRLAEVLKEYPEHQIRIEGHAVQIYHFDEDRAREEQEEVLIPLSRERAEAVKQALVERGVAEERMTARGVGGAEPVVPHGDYEERWKNRRVEFELIRQDNAEEANAGESGEDGAGGGSEN